MCTNFRAQRKADGDVSPETHIARSEDRLISGLHFSGRNSASYITARHPTTFSPSGAASWKPPGSAWSASSWQTAQGGSAGQFADIDFVADDFVRNGSTDPHCGLPRLHVSTWADHREWFLCSGKYRRPREGVRFRYLASFCPHSVDSATRSKAGEGFVHLLGWQGPIRQTAFRSLVPGPSAFNCSQVVCRKVT